MALFTGHTITPDSALGGMEIERSLRMREGQVMIQHELWCG